MKDNFLMEREMEREIIIGIKINIIKDIGSKENKKEMDIILIEEKEL